MAKLHGFSHEEAHTEMIERTAEAPHPAELVRGFFDQIYNRRNWDYVKDHFSVDYIEHTRNGAQSADQCIAIIQGACEVFPDLGVRVIEIVAQSDIAAAHVHFDGTHRGEFFGVGGSGTVVSFEAMEFFRIRDGRITESWGSWPVYDILMQINSKGD